MRLWGPDYDQTMTVTYPSHPIFAGFSAFIPGIADVASWKRPSLPTPSSSISLSWMT